MTSSCYNWKLHCKLFVAKNLSTALIVVSKLEVHYQWAQYLHNFGWHDIETCPWVPHDEALLELWDSCQLSSLNPLHFSLVHVLDHTPSQADSIHLQASCPPCLPRPRLEQWRYHVLQLWIIIVINGINNGIKPITWWLGQMTKWTRQSVYGLMNHVLTMNLSVSETFSSNLKNKLYNSISEPWLSGTANCLLSLINEYSF